ncbi:hypothetical protein [Paenibacillus thalictri]|uniref:SbsC C-terminal domain-containing protein n=1 Tax=Paenibacillus thalictri TaxID=2527873 RepID=A0A4Q9DP89_9BACL|nr:hypothetical protein [Paenibacillus thalictri]TBL77297.1 hypothetical protein EYB31_17600 [Paenibacillus thalictri]
MRKKMIAAGLFLLLSGSTAVYAHLTGAFADFLVTVHDEQTTAKLKEEMQRTKNDIEALAPQAAELERQFAANRGAAAEKLRFYNDMGLDSWLSLMLRAQEPLDLLSAQRLVERNVSAYMQQLDTLYKEYWRLSATQETLEGHKRLLSMIGRNLNARQTFLASSRDVDLEQQANYLDIDWMSEVEPHLLKQLEHDGQLAATRVREWAAASGETPDAAGKLDERWLNEQSELEYFFRPDHVYVVYQKNDDIHVILIGQVLSGGANHTYELQFEAGFFNGFLMPDTLIQELRGFQLPREQLQAAVGTGKPVALQQAGGTLLLRSEP